MHRLVNRCTKILGADSLLVGVTVDFGKQFLQSDPRSCFVNRGRFFAAVDDDPIEHLIGFECSSVSDSSSWRRSSERSATLLESLVSILEVYHGQ